MSDLPKREGHHRRGPTSEDEWEAFNPRARQVLCAFQRAGVIKANKQRFNRRQRRQTRQQLRAPDE